MKVVMKEEREMPDESSPEASPPEVRELPTEKDFLIQLSRDFADFRAAVSRVLAATKPL